jgi:hypothetical protein
MPERITPAKGYKDDKARDEVLKYERRITLDDIRTATKNGLATTADIKAAAKRLGIERRKAARSTGSKQSKEGAKPKAPKRTYGNVPLGKQKIVIVDPTMKKATLYLAPSPRMGLVDHFDNAKFLAEWYTANIEDIKMRSTITDLEFTSTRYKTNIAVRVKVEFTDPRGFELDYIKDLLTFEIGDDYNKMVIVRDGKLVNSRPGREINVVTQVVD